MTIVPLNKPSAEVVLSLVNIDNNIYLNTADVTIQNPVVLTNDTRNTSAEIIGLNGTIFDGQIVPIKYNRLDLGVLTSTTPLLVIGDFYNVETALPILNSLYDLDLTTNELFNYDLDNNNNVTIEVNNSLAYIPNSAVTFRHRDFVSTDDFFYFTTNEFSDLLASIPL
jgi:hypothetical protein